MLHTPLYLSGEMVDIVVYTCTFRPPLLQSDYVIICWTGTLCQSMSYLRPSRFRTIVKVQNYVTGLRVLGQTYWSEEELVKITQNVPRDSPRSFISSRRSAKWI